MSRPLRYYHDHEFLEDGSTIELISTGIVCEDGRRYYAVNADMSLPRVLQHRWLPDNVVPYLPTKHLPGHLVGTPDRLVLNYDHPDVKPHRQIAAEVHAFLMADGLGPLRDARELWAWYAAYDHVALCQLWGTMMDLPPGVPMFTRDLKSEAVRLGNPTVPEQATKEHHALADAAHDHTIHMFLEDLEASRA